MPPPHGLSRGKTFLSRRTVETPSFASVRPAMEPAGPPPTTRTSASYVVIWEVTPETYRVETPKGQEAPGHATARRLLPFVTPIACSTAALAPTRDHGSGRTRREKDEGRGLGRRRRAWIGRSGT